MSTTTRPRLKVRYDQEVRAQLKSELGLGNIMEVRSEEHTSELQSH